MKLLGFKINIYLVIAAVLLFISGSQHVCMKTSVKEAMTLISNSDKFITNLM